MSGKTWREAREQGVEVRLPSGNEVRIRPMEVDFFILNGEIPDVLAPVINLMINAKPYSLPLGPGEETTEVEKWKKWVTFLNTLVTFALISPKVVENPQADDEISIDDIGYGDKMLVYQFFSRPAQILRGFREQQNKPLELMAAPGSNGQTVQPDTQDRSMGKSRHRTARHVDIAATG